MTYLIIFLTTLLIIGIYFLTLPKESKIKSLNIMTYSTQDVANYFLQKGESDPTMTPMKLIKLVYIAHGWNLGLTSQPLVTEDAEAWKYGPVFPSLYKKYREFKDGKIKPEPVKELNIKDVDDLTFLDKIWNFYSKYDGLQLSTKTHEPNTPWSVTWEKAKQTDTISENSLIIPNTIIAQHYCSLSPAK